MSLKNIWIPIAVLAGLQSSNSYALPGRAVVVAGTEALTEIADDATRFLARRTVSVPISDREIEPFIRAINDLPTPLELRSMFWHHWLPTLGFPMKKLKAAADGNTEVKSAFDTLSRYQKLFVSPELTAELWQINLNLQNANAAMRIARLQSETEAGVYFGADPFFVMLDEINTVVETMTRHRVPGFPLVSDWLKYLRELGRKRVVVRDAFATLVEADLDAAENILPEELVAIDDQLAKIRETPQFNRLRLKDGRPVLNFQAGGTP